MFLCVSVLLHVQPASLCATLDDKFTFCRFCEETLKITDGTVPKVSKFSSKREALAISRSAETKMVLKPLAYDPLRRLDLVEVGPGCDNARVDTYLSELEEAGALSSERPWLAQTSFRAELSSIAHEASAAVIVRDGRVTALTVRRALQSRCL